MAKVAGSIWIEGAEFHYIASDETEYMFTGNDLGEAPAGAVKGSCWIEERGGGASIHYISDETPARKRHLPVVWVQGRPAATSGSTWIHTTVAGNYQLHIAAFIVDHGVHEYAAHADAAAYSDHADVVEGTHSDVAASHSDVAQAHTDTHGDTTVAHSDVAYAHSDIAHGDYYSDSTQYYYTDTSGGKVHTDTHTDAHTDSYSDHTDAYTDHDDTGYSDYTDYTDHDDHNDYGDDPYSDTHYDEAHSDHEDVPYSDYTDSPYSDSHADEWNQEP